MDGVWWLRLVRVKAGQEELASEFCRKWSGVSSGSWAERGSSFSKKANLLLLQWLERIAVSSPAEHGPAKAVILVRAEMHLPDAWGEVCQMLRLLNKPQLQRGRLHAAIRDGYRSGGRYYRMEERAIWSVEVQALPRKTEWIREDWRGTYFQRYKMLLQSRMIHSPHTQWTGQKK